MVLAGPSKWTLSSRSGDMSDDGRVEGLCVEWVDGPSDTSLSLEDLAKQRDRQHATRRRQVVAALVVAALALAGLGVWHWTRPAPPLVFTVAGRTVDNPALLVAQADSYFHKAVSAHGGATTRGSRCYFLRVGGKATTDIGTDAYCGPVLFHGGAPSAPYLRFALPERPGAPAGHATLTVVASPESFTTVARPRHLVRPDRRMPPPGVDGLIAPPPWPVSATYIAPLAAADARDLASMPTSAFIGSRTVNVQLVASGVISSFGAGINAHAAPRGENLRAFELRIQDGETTLSSSDVLPNFGVSVDGGDVRSLNLNLDAAIDTTDLIRYGVVAVPISARSVDLVVSEAGVDQTVSLLTGATGADNVAILRRPVGNRSNNVRSASVTVAATYSGNGPTRSVPLTLEIDYDYLGYFSPYNDGAAHASGPDRALLNLDVCFHSGDLFGPDDQAGSTLCMTEPNYLLTPAGGSPIRARDFGDNYVAVDVAANITSADVTVLGPMDLGGGVTLRLSHPVQLKLELQS